jgi:tRNA threonylcarbamoyladenosine biosynthesis protein TsaB
VTSLDALAHVADAADMEVVASVLDARRGEVFWALYRAADRAALTEPQVGSPESCIADITARGQTVAVIGSGMQRHRELFADHLRLAVPAHTLGEPHEPLADEVAALGFARAMRQMTSSVDEIVPMYLRAPDAEINWATRSSL